MTLSLNEYIKMSYKRPNKAVLRGLGASEELIEYLCETPENTNWNIINSISENTGGKTKIFEGTMRYTVTQGPYRPLAQSYQTLTNTFDINCNSLIVYFENEEYELVKQDNAYKNANGLVFYITDSGTISGGITQSSFPITIQQGQLYNIEIYAII